MNLAAARQRRSEPFVELVRDRREGEVPGAGLVPFDPVRRHREDLAVAGLDGERRSDREEVDRQDAEVGDPAVVRAVGQVEDRPAVRIFL